MSGGFSAGWSEARRAEAGSLKYRERGGFLGWGEQRVPFPPARGHGGALYLPMGEESPHGRGAPAAWRFSCILVSEIVSHTSLEIDFADLWSDHWGSNCHKSPQHAAEVPLNNYEARHYYVQRLSVDESWPACGITILSNKHDFMFYFKISHK